MMRVLLATDRPDLGHALSLFLSEQQIQVIDVVDDCGRLLQQTEAARPDVVLVDWRLGEAAAGQAIADLTYLSINSVKSYIRSAYRKIGVERRSQAVRWGMENEMLPDRSRVIVH